MNERSALFEDLAQYIAKLPATSPQCVAIDGVDGAGKTRFADELGRFVSDLGRPVIRASVDGFHNPKELRYRLGRGSPEGFFRESYNYMRLREALLDPLTKNGERFYKTAVFDVDADLPVEMPKACAESSSILIIDGIFLHRHELKHYWSYSIFLRVPFEISIPRGAQRGAGSPDPNAPANKRYIDGQRLYFSECEPESAASVVIDYSDLASPKILSRKPFSISSR